MGPSAQTTQAAASKAAQLCSSLGPVLSQMPPEYSVSHTNAQKHFLLCCAALDVVLLNV